MYGLYLHIPFCIHKCFYCDFYSVEQLEKMDKFVDDLAAEIKLRTNADKKIPTYSVFIGGGTPSLLKPFHLEKIGEVLHERFDIPERTEWTMECNPGEMAADSLKAAQDIGVNRLSIGVQSFNEEELKFLERIHSSAQADKAVELARSLDFDNISIDFISSIPGQTKEKLEHTLERVIALQPEHISSYSLIYEEGTPLYKSWKAGKISKIDEDADADLYLQNVRKLNEAGFEQYEVSNFAKEGKKCRHNINYWKGGEYYAFGPSAHGFLDGVRFWNTRSIGKYSEMIADRQSPVEDSEKLTTLQKMTERVILGLRSDGIDLEHFRREFGPDINKILGKEIEDMKKEGLIKFNGNSIKLTVEGYLINDGICVTFIRNLENIL